MRINIHAEGFDLRPQLRAAVESRLLAALGAFAGRIQFVTVHLQARLGRHQPDTTSCEVAVTLRPSGEVRVRADGAQMQMSIDRAAQAIRAAVERELAEPLPPDLPPVTEDAGGPGALEIVLDGNWISHHTREMLERPDNYLRPIRIRALWQPSAVEDTTHRRKWRKNWSTRSLVVDADRPYRHVDQTPNH